MLLLFLLLDFVCALLLVDALLRLDDAFPRLLGGAGCLLRLVVLLVLLRFDADALLLSLVLVCVFGLCPDESLSDAVSA